MMDKKLEQVIIKIAKALNDSDITWSIGASLLLNRYRLIDNPTDIDITVVKSDIHKIDKILSILGEKQPESKSDIYRTDYFFEYIIDGASIDVMAGLKIRTEDSVFEYIFDKKSVPHSFVFDHTPVPFSTLEEWFVLYQLMPGKENKATLIDSYFQENGVQYPYLLERICNNQNLSLDAKERINNILIKSLRL